MNLIKLTTDKSYRTEMRKEKAMAEAIKEADRLHKLTGHKYFVMQIGDEFIPLNMRGINIMKQRKLLPKNYDWLRAEKHAVYITKSN